MIFIDHLENDARSYVEVNQGTIIAINENPYPNRQGNLTAAEVQSIPLIRRNMVNVIKQLSKSNAEWRAQHPIETLPIRWGLQPIEGSDITSSDEPSLLFYYLFDDWYTSYSLVAKQEHQYAKQLDLLVCIFFWLVFSIANSV